MIKIFVYSELQVKDEIQNAESRGSTFICGEVVIGGTKVKYSNLIREEELDAMIALYPDTKIVYKGPLSDVTYTRIKN